MLCLGRMAALRGVALCKKSLMKTLNSLIALMLVMVCMLSATISQAEETQHADGTALSSTTLSGYLDTSAIWNLGTGIQLFSIPVSNPVGTFPGTSEPWYPTNRPTHFVAMLSFASATNAFFAGTGDFLIGCETLQFNLDIPLSFSNIVGAALSAPSRQATVNLGTGQFSPVSTNMWLPFYSVDGVLHFSGLIPLNETLRSELQNGQGQFSVYLSRSFWDQQQIVLRGNLLGVLNPNETNSTACWPRHPRSISARYTKGTTPLYPVDYELPNLDVDRDGQPDYSLSSGTLCTASIPAFCTTFFSISSLRSNELLLNHYSSAILEMGARISSQPPTNANWSVASGAAITGTSFGASDYNFWSGPLGYIGEGYLGTRMAMADGWHYGWIRVHLPGINDGFGMSLVFEDWAFEPQADTPILAGAKPFEVAAQSLGIVRPGYLRIQIPTEPGRSYIVQRKPTLSTLDWENASYIFIATSTSIQIDLPIANAMGFYRILEAD